MNGNVSGVVQGFQDGSERYGRVGGKDGKWFNARVCRRQDCIILPWFFNVFMNGILREVREWSREIFEYL